MKTQKPGTLLDGFLAGLIVVGIMWAVKLAEEAWHFSLAAYGLLPRDWKHLYGIFTMPFIHGNWEHLIGNSSSLLVLTTLTVWTYRNIYPQVSLMLVLLGGFWTWLLGRPDYHIGASGVIYGYASFLFFAGIFSRNYRMMALSMLVVFLYGSFFWGIFPMKEGVSWEGHISGAAAGLVAAYYYRDRLPKRKTYDWELEDDEEEEKEEESNEMAFHSAPENTLIHYYYKEVNKHKNNSDEQSDR